MKIICSTILVVFFSSFVCCGFKDFWIDEDSSITKEDVKNITDSPADPSLEEEIFNDEKEEDEGSWVKDAGLGLGKAALGLGCAYIAVVASLQKTPDYGWVDRRLKNNLFLLLRDYFFEGPRAYKCEGRLFHNIDNSYAMNECLNMILARLCLIGGCTYGAYKCTVSAYNSFKSFKKRTNSVTEEIVFSP